MSAPRPTGDRLAVIYGYSLPEGAHPVEGERVEVDAGGERPVEAIDGGRDRRRCPGTASTAASRPTWSTTAPTSGRSASSAAAVSSRSARRAASDIDLEVGSFVCPDDFYAPETAPSFYDDPRGHSVPGLRRRLARGDPERPGASAARPS